MAEKIKSLTWSVLQTKSFSERGLQRPTRPRKLAVSDETVGRHWWVSAGKVKQIPADDDIQLQKKSIIF